MDEHVIRPGSWLLTDGPPTSPMLFRPPSYKIRVTGPDIDMSLSIDDLTDIEIVEKLLAKIRASVSASLSQTSTGESK